MTTRRDFVVRTLGLAAVATIGDARRLLGAIMAETRVNVRESGARGDGRTNDTAAFARALASLPAAGGTIVVPDGTYLIDPLTSIVLRSNMTLQLAPRAVLQAMPVSDPHSAVVTVNGATNVRVTGGTIVGEKATHTGTGGEWGMGITVNGGADITIDGVTTRDCWGDGLYVGGWEKREAQRVTIRNCKSIGNRRQGLSVTGLVGGLVEHCEFAGTSGTAPQAGIDVEPRKYDVKDLVIRGCTVSGNTGWGILLSGNRISAVTIEDSTVTGNQYIAGIGVWKAHECIVRRNVVERNARHGILVYKAANNEISGNTVRRNGFSGPMRFENISVSKESSGNRITGNVFTDDGPSDSATEFDVLLEAGSSNNQLSGNRYRPRRMQGSLTVGGVQDQGAGNGIK